MHRRRTNEGSVDPEDHGPYPWSMGRGVGYPHARATRGVGKEGDGSATLTDGPDLRNGNRPPKRNGSVHPGVGGQTEYDRDHDREDGGSPWPGVVGCPGNPVDEPAGREASGGRPQMSENGHGLMDEGTGPVERGNGGNLGGFGDTEPGDGPLYHR